MRLTCPDCDAKYEVDDALIPEGGRDVQCSNCDATWFQTGPAARSADVEVFPADRAEGRDGPPPQDAPPLKPIEERHSPETLAALREEREHEMRARAADAAGVPDAEEVDDVGAQERARMGAAAAVARARRDGEGGGGGATAPETRARRHLQPRNDAPRGAERLPDIAPDEDRLQDDAVRAEERPARPRRVVRAEPEPKRSGFRAGFLTVAVLIAVAALVYVFAPDIAAQVPQLADPLGDYTVFVDEQRVALDRGVAALTDWIEGFTAGGPEPIRSGQEDG